MRRFDYRALGRLKAGEMNKTEKRYADHLETLKAQGEILWWKFEALKFRLADKTFYSPDFAVMNKCSEIELHEVKGFMADDANVKIKVASSMYPFVFKLIRLKNGMWEIAEVGNAA